MFITLAPDPSFHDISRKVGKLFEQMQKGYSPFSPGETWTPAVNLYENETAYLVCVDLAGVNKDKIEITVEGNLLRILGSRDVPTQDGQPTMKGIRMHLLEIDHGAFAREVELPVDVRQENIGAEYINGMLWIELPKEQG